MIELLLFFGKDTKDREQNIGYQTLLSVIRMTASLQKTTQKLSFDIAENNFSQKEKTQYASILNNWNNLSKLEIIKRVNRYPHNEIINIFSAYQKQALQKETTSSKVILTNLKLLDGFLSAILKQLITLEKNYDFTKID